MLHEFRLSPRLDGGVFCDESGAFVGAIPMLARTRGNGKDEWRPRDCDDLAQEMSAQYGLPIDMSSKRGGLTVIAKALGEGDVARAQVATVLLGIPHPPSLSKGAPSRQEMIAVAADLRWSGLLKADWDPDEHPRWPAGNADGKGGEFAPKGEGGETAASPISQANTTEDPRPDGARPDTRIQLADAGVSDASDDPAAQAAASAAEAQRNASAHDSPANSEHEGFWQRLGSELSEDTKALLTEIGRAQIEQSNADLAAATAGADAIAHTVRAYAEYRAQPWLGADGRPVEVPVFNTGDPLSDQAAMIGELSKPNASLTRPATNADWIDPLVNLVSLAAMAVGPAFRLAGAAAEGVEAVDVAALSSETATYRATLGKALTNNYRKTFLESNPELEGQVVVHHAVPRITLERYPSEVTEPEIHSLENLRGIPNELNSDLHLSQIAREWNRFYEENPNATRGQLLQKATEIDLKYGGRFKPPVGGGK